MNWLSLATIVVDKIPVERLLVKRPDNKKRLTELADILGQAKPKPVESQPDEANAPDEEPAGEPLPGNLGNQRPRVHLEPNPSVTSTVSTKETVDYQNREIGKNLLMLQRHLVQKFRINDRACDCGQSKHLLELEGLAEETIGMVDNPDIYYRVLDWVQRLGPISTVEKISSGKYDDKYAAFGTEARDLRKELMGTLDAKALFPAKAEEAAEVQEAEE